MQSLEIDDSWSFKDASPSQTSYITHDYHRYPAKFIPQLAGRIIKENSRVGDLICDPFMGSGTTLVEAIVNKRRAYGTDINPVSVLISKAKTTPIEPVFLKQELTSLLEKTKVTIANGHGEQRMLCIHTNDNFDTTILDNERLDYWFPEKQKRDLAPILSIINAVEDQNVRIFLLCSFSNILKRCSRWMSKSTKPTIDRDKIIADAYKSFQNQIEKMAAKNEKFWNMLVDGGEDTIIVDCVVDNTDARKLKINDDSVTLVITSPPYVTSYEYADLHQLTSIWLGYIDNLPEFRSKFIGSIQKDIKSINLYSKTGKETVGRLRSINKREAKGVEQYFFEMQQCFEEIYRVLKRKGRAAIIVGDTDLRGVKIQNACVFTETLSDIGFKTHNIIKREVPSKTLPTKRDRKTGRFASTKVYNRLAYPTEYILIMEKI